jgi:hypothetical protein
MFFRSLNVLNDDAFSGLRLKGDEQELLGELLGLL